MKLGEINDVDGDQLSRSKERTISKKSPKEKLKMVNEFLERQGVKERERKKSIDGMREDQFKIQTGSFLNGAIN